MGLRQQEKEIITCSYPRSSVSRKGKVYHSARSLHIFLSQNAKIGLTN